MSEFESNTIKGLVKVVNQQADIIDSLCECIGEVRQCYNTLQSIDKRVRNLEENINSIKGNSDIVASEMMHVSGYAENIKNSSFLTQTTLIRMLNYMKDGEASL